MPHTRIITMVTVATLMFLFISKAAAIDTDKLKLSASITLNSGDTNSTTYAWAGHGKWHTGAAQDVFSLEVDTKYSKSSNSPAYNRLKTWWRYEWNSTDATKWHPLFLISTEGDHSLRKVHTVGAIGFAKNYGSGTIEITAGASKDITTSEAWMGDIGVLLSYEKKWGRLKWNINPQGEVSVLGDVRVRGGHMRYNIDTGLDYALSNNLCASYRMSFGNTTDGASRTQLLGLTYRR